MAHRRLRAIALTAALAGSAGAGAATLAHRDPPTRIELNLADKTLAAGETFEVEVIPPENVCYSPYYRLMLRSGGRWVATHDLSAAVYEPKPSWRKPEGDKPTGLMACFSGRTTHELQVPTDAKPGRYRLKKWFSLGDERAQELVDNGYEVSATAGIDAAWWVDFDVVE